MKVTRRIRALVLALAISLGATTGVALANDAAPAELALDAAPSADPAPTPAPPPSPIPPDTQSLEERLLAAQRALEAYRNADGPGRVAAIFGIIAALSWFLMGALKKTTVGGKWKKYIPKVLLGLGVVVGFSFYMASGAGVVASFIYGAGPPFATFIHELLFPSKPTEA